MSNGAICTICSKNYLPFARVLMHSVRRHHPDFQRVVLLLDQPEGCFDPAQEDFEVVSYQELGLPDVQRFFFKYSILEANTAVKPWLLKLLLARGIQRVIYLDPDIGLYSPLQEVESAFQGGANIVLTPHLTAPIEDDRSPSEVNILQAGVWNLGFLAIQKSQETARFLDWFCARLTDHCVVDIAKGLFVDQKWMDLVPGLFADVELLRHPGYNVAYWNLPHRSISERDGQTLANGVPLRFCHFSGFDPQNVQQFSKHQNRYQLRDLSPAMRQRALDYAQQLLESGYETCRRWHYVFGTFQDGVSIPDSLRAHYRRNKDLQKLLGPNPFGRPSLLLNQDWQGGRLHPANSFVMQGLWESQEHLQRVFPQPDGADRLRYLDWYIQNAQGYGIPAAFVPQLVNTAEPSPPSRVATFSHIARSLELKSLLNVGRGLERRVRRLRKRWQSRMQPAKPLPSRGVGCNVIGYVRCEMGVAEAARAGVRALSAADVPLSLMDCSELAHIEMLDDSLQTPISNVAAYNTNLMFVNADQTSYVQGALPDGGWSQAYNIGFWHWELEEFPDEWRPAFDCLNEVWVASRFVQASIAAKAPCPVVNMGLPVNLRGASPDPARFGSSGKFMFLTSCDLNSFSARKNPLGAVLAFCRAFGDRTDVELVLKVSSPQVDAACLDQLHSAIGGRRNIRVLSGLLRRAEVVSLLATAGCYVSLHRSEGFGLGMAESMALGKPVIGTGYSGNLDFMRPGNSCLVDYSLLELDQDHGPYRKGQVWADPDLDHAAWWMKRVVEDNAERTRIGQAAQRSIAEEFSDAAIGQRFRKRLSIIWSRMNARTAA